MLNTDSRPEARVLCDHPSEYGGVQTREKEAHERNTS